MSILELNLTEDNEIGFKLKIEGSDKDIGSTKPNIRFVLSEEDSGAGWIFNASKTDDGVAVVIPSMKGIISEDKKYNGKLEVILAGRYFTPTEVDVKFNEPLKVEAAVSTVVKKNTEKLLEDVKPSHKEEESKELSIESEIDSIIIKEKANNSIPFKAIKEEIEEEPQILKEEVKKPKSYQELNENQKALVNDLFLDKCRKLGIETSEVKKLMKEGTSYTKKRLTALLAKSTKEFIDSI